MSKELKQFYREIWKWIQEGCPEHVTFHPKRALCSALAFWGGMNVSLHVGVYDEQRKLLDSLGSWTSCPFNQDLDDWANERKLVGFYQNPKRLTFIEEHAK